MRRSLCTCAIATVIAVAGCNAPAAYQIFRGFWTLSDFLNLAGTVTLTAFMSADGDAQAGVTAAKAACAAISNCIGILNFYSKDDVPVLAHGGWR